MSSRRRSAATEFERLLRDIEPGHRRRKVREALDGHFTHPARRDHRGRRSAALRKAVTTLRHIVGMQRWVLDDERYDVNVRRRVRSYLRHIDHRVSWSQTVDECQKARGLVNGATRKRHEQEEFGSGDPVVLDADHVSHPLNSVAKLQRGGRRGGNCLRDNDFGYHDELRDRDAEFHEIRRSGVAVAWLRVECGFREITDIYGPGNEEADLPVEVLWELCRKLDVSGDGQEVFLGKGVLTMFLDGAADPEAPMRVVSAGYRFWWRRGEIVVHDSRRDRWSRFRWRGRRWRAAGPSALDDGQFEVLRRCIPRVNLLALAARPKRARRPKRKGR